MKVEYQDINKNAVIANRAKKLAGSFGRTVVYRHSADEKAPMQIIQDKLIQIHPSVKPTGKKFLTEKKTSAKLGFAPISNLHTTVIAMNVVDATSSA